MSARRQSRRILGEDPKVAATALGPVNKEMKNLLSKGGVNGKIDIPNSDWDYFPMPKRRKITASMMSVDELKNDIEEMKNYEERQENNEQSGSTYLLLHVDQVNSLNNFKCETCKDKKQCVSEEMKFKTYGMATAINLQCYGCNEEREVPPKLSNFAGKDKNGNPSRKKNNTWYETNLRLVLGSLAVGNGSSDLSDFAAFMGLPQASSFGKRPFNKIECIIGESIRQVAQDSMHKALEEEIRRTLEDLGVSYQDWKAKKIDNKHI